MSAERTRVVPAIFVLACFCGSAGASQSAIAAAAKTGPNAVAANVPTPANVYVVPFSHLDLYWAGTREECLSRGNRIISKAIQLALRQPEFRFLIEDEVFTANYVETHRGTEELSELKRLVSEGRFELAPKWAGILQNLPRGESHVRNQIYGKRYAREVFGVDPPVAHLGDLPGYTSQFPQILARSDTPFMAMTRMGPRDHPMFRWRSPDGSTTLVWNAVNGYGWGVGLGLHRDLDREAVEKVAESVGKVQSNTKGPIFLGWGTDLFAPSEKLVGNVALLNERLAPVRFRMATPTEFFRAAVKTPDVPVLAGEIPSSWANIISSMSHLWPPAMAATDALLQAETFAAITDALGYVDYPHAELESLWKQVLQAMDHNNFGQGGDTGDDRKIEYAQGVRQRAGQILRDRLRDIAERVAHPIPRSTPIVVFNPSSWQRDDLVETHASLYGDVAPSDIADYRKAIRLVDETGASIPFHVDGYSGTVSRALEIGFVARAVPPLGYRTYFIVPAQREEAFPNASTIQKDDADPARPKRVLGEDSVESDFYRVTVDRATGRLSVFDKALDLAVANDVEIVGSEERGGDTLSVERPTGRTLVNEISGVEIERNDPVRAVVRIEGAIDGIPITQRVTLYRALKRIDLENVVDWRQGRFMKLEQLFPYEREGSELCYGIPFGSAGASEIMPGSGPQFRDEVPVEVWKQWRQIQDWVFVGTPGYSLTIAADRQLVTLGDGVVRAGMLRSSYSPVGVVRDGKPFLRQFPPAGRYVFRYSLSSGKGDWRAAKPYRAGMAFSNPLLAVTAVDELSAKPLPVSQSFLTFAAEDVVVTAVKKAENGRGVVLRAVEMEGSRAEAPVRFLGRDRRFRAVNLLEEEAREADEDRWRLAPYEIGTVRLSVQ